MGSELTKKCYSAFFIALQRGKPFTTNERLILLYMASKAHDNDQPPRYWGGREALAVHALGRLVPDHDAAAARSIYESVRKALHGLGKGGHGAIELDERGAFPGRRQEYFLTVDKCLPTEWRAQPADRSFATSGWDKHNNTLQMAQPPVGPNNQETPTDQEETTSHFKQGSHLVSVDNDAA